MSKEKETTKGLFFWRKGQDKEVKKAEEMMKLFLKYLPLLKIADQEMNKRYDEEAGVSSDGKIIGRMYDFFEDHGELLNNDWIGGTTIITNPSSLDVNSQPTKKDERIEATPVSVMAELERVPTPFTIEGLEEKIATLSDKTKLLNQRFAKDQIKGLLKRLENRRKYAENFKFYNSFPNTTDEKIDNLLKKYKLIMKTSDLFVPTFPKEAIDIMKEYSRVTKAATKEKPVYYVIAEEKDFKEKYKKLDPILLAQSPFGFYWQILGAWDKEMLLLHEL